MAQTLYLKDGSTEYLLAGETAQEKLQRIISEHLGQDCEELFEEIIDDLTISDTDEWENIADGYHSILMDTLNNLHEALEKPRLDRKKIERIHNYLNRNL